VNNAYISIDVRLLSPDSTVSGKVVGPLLDIAYSTSLDIEVEAKLI
jgi:hypothetical protein